MIAGVLFSHAFSGKLKAVSVVNEAIQDRIAEGWVTEHRRVQQSLAGSCLTSRLRIRGTPCMVIGSQS
jgi:hypothetical protein